MKNLINSLRGKTVAVYSLYSTRRLVPQQIAPEVRELLHRNVSSPTSEQVKEQLWEEIRGPRWDLNLTTTIEEVFE